LESPVGGGDSTHREGVAGRDREKKIFCGPRGASRKTVGDSVQPKGANPDRKDGRGELR